MLEEPATVPSAFSGYQVFRNLRDSSISTYCRPNSLSSRVSTMSPYSSCGRAATDILRPLERKRCTTYNTSHTYKTLQRCSKGIPAKPPEFEFRQRSGKLNARAIANIDMERLVEDVDIDLLQEHLENIVFSDVTIQDLSQYTDEHFLKLFQIAQLIVEYLLNVQESMTSYCQEVEEECDELMSKNKSLKKKSEQYQIDIQHLKKDIKTKQNTLVAMQKMLAVPVQSKLSTDICQTNQKGIQLNLQYETGRIVYLTMREDATIKGIIEEISKIERVDVKTIEIKIQKEVYNVETCKDKMLISLLIQHGLETNRTLDVDVLPFIIFPEKEVKVEPVKVEVQTGEEKNAILCDLDALLKDKYQHLEIQQEELQKQISNIKSDIIKEFEPLQKHETMIEAFDEKLGTVQASISQLGEALIKIEGLMSVPLSAPPRASTPPATPVCNAGDICNDGDDTLLLQKEDEIHELLNLLKQKEKDQGVLSHLVDAQNQFQMQQKKLCERIDKIASSFVPLSTLDQIMELQQVRNRFSETPTFPVVCDTQEKEVTSSDTPRTDTHTYLKGIVKLQAIIKGKLVRQNSWVFIFMLSFFPCEMRIRITKGMTGQILKKLISKRMTSFRMAIPEFEICYSITGLPIVDTDNVFAMKGKLHICMKNPSVNNTESLVKEETLQKTRISVMIKLQRYIRAWLAKCRYKRRLNDLHRFASFDSPFEVEKVKALSKEKTKEEKDIMRNPLMARHVLNKNEIQTKANILLGIMEQQLSAIVLLKEDHDVGLHDLQYNRQIRLLEDTRNDQVKSRIAEMEEQLTKMLHQRGQNVNEQEIFLSP